jgi:hypothetical protein
MLVNRLEQQQLQHPGAKLCRDCCGPHIEGEPCYIQPLRDHVPASLPAPGPHEASYEDEELAERYGIQRDDFDQQLYMQPSEGWSDSSEDSMQEELLTDDEADNIVLQQQLAHQQQLVPIPTRRKKNSIRPERLRYFFWDSECGMREDAGHPPPDINGDDDGPNPQQAGDRLYHDPLLVMGELLCVPCMTAGYGMNYNKKKQYYKI